MLCGVAFCADAALAAKANRLAERAKIARRMTISPVRLVAAGPAVPCLVLLYDRFVTAG